MHVKFYWTGDTPNYHTQKREISLIIYWSTYEFNSNGTITKAILNFRAQLSNRSVRRNSKVVIQCTWLAQMFNSSQCTHPRVLSIRIQLNGDHAREKKKQAGIDDDSVNAVLELRRPFVQRVVTLKAGLYSVYFAGHVCHIYESD